MPRKTDSNNPSDWLWFASNDLAGIASASRDEAGFTMCRSRLAEALEKIMKAELIRSGWRLEKTHDLRRLLLELSEREPDNATEFGAAVKALSGAYFADRYPGFDCDDEDWPAIHATLASVQALLAKVETRVTPR